MEISSSDLMEDERLKGSATARALSGSLPVGEGGIVVSSTMEVDAIAARCLNRVRPMLSLGLYILAVIKGVFVAIEIK